MFDIYLGNQKCDCDEDFQRGIDPVRWGCFEPYWADNCWASLATTGLRFELVTLARYRSRKLSLTWD